MVITPEAPSTTEPFRAYLMALASQVNDTSLREAFRGAHWGSPDYADLASMAEAAKCPGLCALLLTAARTGEPMATTCPAANGKNTLACIRSLPSGDTVASLAAQYLTLAFERSPSEDELTHYLRNVATANGITDLCLVRAGQVIKFPVV